MWYLFAAFSHDTDHDRTIPPNNIVDVLRHCVTFSVQSVGVENNADIIVAMKSEKCTSTCTLHAHLSISESMLLTDVFRAGS